MIGQMHILDYLEDDYEEMTYVKYFANWLKAYCDYWKKDWLVKIKDNKTIESIYSTICNFRRIHFFNLEGVYFDRDLEYYGARFVKGENVIEFYKCGSNSEKILATEPVSKLLEELVQG